MIKIGFYSEDHKMFLLLSSALGKEFQVQLESDEDRMNNLLLARGCDVMILDLNSTSDSLQERIGSARRMMTSLVPSIVLGDDDLRATAFELVRTGAFSYCRRPPSIRDLKAMLSRAYENSALRQHPKTVPEKLGELNSCDRLIGSGSQMQRVYQLVRRVTNLNAAVLITGESGTGKELIARAIHNLGSRSSDPFVAVSCGSIPETLIEAELFGHEKGAFTGTVGLREGYFEKAGKGTLFLDEIGDLSLFTQVKLLRVLQEMEFSRLGSSRLIPLRARLIFATNRNLPKMVADGTFRQDLFYRINVMQIEAPALQDHLEDIPRIARHFLAHYSQLFEKPMTDIEPDALALLQRYQWRGNVRELENVMQRAIILADGSTVRTEDLTLTTKKDDGADTYDAVDTCDVADTADVVDIGDYHPACSSFERQLRDYKIRLAVGAVRESNGNKTMAARSLGISRAYVHRLINLAEPDQLFELDAPVAVNA